MNDDRLTGARHRELDEFDDPPTDPVALLCAWLDEASASGVREPHALVLATTRPSGEPATRTVSVKRWDERGLVFSSHATSRKGRDLEHDPRAAGTFYWRETLQQINVAGRIEATSDDESDALFLDRPPEARAATVVSEQSELLIDESALWRAAEAVLASDAVSERPATWSGYRLVPDRIEFWQGSTDRLHRRLEYRRAGDRWVAERLQP